MKKLNVRTEHRSVLAICLFVFAIFFVGLPQQAKAQYQPPDSCLYLPWPQDVGNGYYNEDSLLIDSCKNSIYLGKWFGKIFEISFSEYVFFSKPIQLDSSYTYNEIDSVNYEQTYTSFKNLEYVFGNFFIKRAAEITDDSVHIYRPICNIIFNNYVPIDSVKVLLKNIELVIFAYIKHPAFVTYYKDNNYENIKSKFKFKTILNEDFINIKITEDIIIKSDEIILQDSYGRNCNINKFINSEQIQIDISELTTGIYFIKIQNYTNKFLLWR